MTAVLDAGGAALRIDGLRRVVSDLGRSVDFYCGALGFRRVAGDATPPGNATRLRLGDQHIDLIVSRDAAGSSTGPNAPDPRFQHAAVVTDDMGAAWRRLGTHAFVAISRDGPQQLPPHTGGVVAFKFRDPDGHPLELIEFPAGVGDPRWHDGRTRGPTLGIDHFALVVGDLDRSVAFFTERLALGVTGRDVNRGIEQDRLDGLDDVEVDVVTLAPRHGAGTPHLELLHYRHPRFTAPPGRTPASPDGDEIVCLGKQRAFASAAALCLRDPDGHRFVVEG